MVFLTVDPTTIPDWDAQVLSFPGATFAHSVGWARVLIDTYGHIPLYQIVKEGDRLLALLTCMEVNSWLTGLRGVCLPFTDFCAPAFTAPPNPLMSDGRPGEAPKVGHDLASQLYESLMALGRSRGWKTLEFRGPIPIPNARPSVSFRRHVLDLAKGQVTSGSDAQPSASVLPPSLSELRRTSSPSSFALRASADKQPSDAQPSASVLGPRSSVNTNLSASNRRSIRKAEQAGVTCEVRTDLEAVREFYRLHALTRRKHGAPPQPFRFFENVHRHIISQGLGFVMLARYEGRTIAANVYLLSIPCSVLPPSLSELRRTSGPSSSVLGPRSSVNSPSSLVLRTTSTPRSFLLRSSSFGGQAVAGPRQSLASYKYGASDPNYQRLRASNLLMWKAIEWLADHGYETLDLGRTSISNEGLSRFKKAFGADQETAEYYRYDFRRSDWATSADRAEGWQAAVFRRMPLAVNATVGCWAYRHLD